ncbi:hypothetical protein J8273_1907 [Carpediemonas membranifera]|uniref:Uncharacterized protein n=1 Tax=Carpediemonas membranifera TaxID=201153 RepID=A0A8J6B0T0_9EUKA|nr:hypothetical protein J8273_1907 [Carpediemonas membranifera]|eukprot:KAG9396860.1 hypothetical protein J8273_1907 [Carpediemonas membranifera]
MHGSKSEEIGIRYSIISAYRAAVLLTASTAGDVPSLLRHAYSRHFKHTMPLIQEQEGASRIASDTSLESLVDLLAKVPMLKPGAQTLLDRARSILTDGPPLSMNVELADGQELPVALHTLLQGTLWSIIMQTGANPDLDDKLPTEFQERFRPDAKILWFICRKFFFCHNIAAKDGESNFIPATPIYMAYAGRLLTATTTPAHPLARVRLPRLVALSSCGHGIIAQTTRGLWGWCPAAEVDRGCIYPTPLSFSSCPKTAAYETGLPPWNRAELVTHVSLDDTSIFILTRVGLVMAGNSTTTFFSQLASGGCCLREVTLPEGFVPDHIMNQFSVVIISMGDQQMIWGPNDHGQLGLGHREPVPSFTPLPFHVDRVLGKTAFTNTFTIFLSDHRLVLAGDIPHAIFRAGLHSQGNTPGITPLSFAGSVIGWSCGYDYVVWVTEGRTNYVNTYLDVNYVMQFEATALSLGNNSFRDKQGLWFTTYRVSGGVAEVHPGDEPPTLDIIEIFPVLVNPGP